MKGLCPCSGPEERGPHTTAILTVCIKAHSHIDIHTAHAQPDEGILIQTVLLLLVGTGLYHNARAKSCPLLPWQFITVAMAVWCMDIHWALTNSSPQAIVCILCEGLPAVGLFLVQHHLTTACVCGGSLTAHKCFIFVV